MSVFKRKIEDLVDENHIFAAVLHYFGVKFYQYPDHTLGDLCTEKCIDSALFIKQLESSGRENGTQIDFEKFPIDLIVEYLKHMHHIFVKQRLPYISGLIKSYSSNNANSALFEELKNLLPYFIEDFIYHIYEEEDTLFTYANSLLQMHSNRNKMHISHELLEKSSITKFALAHAHHDSEMDGIAESTNNFTLLDSSDLHAKVIFEELKQFRDELQVHANIEDKILFPKALFLENQLKDLLQNGKNLN